MIMATHGLLVPNYHNAKCPELGNYDTADLLDWFVSNRQAWTREKAVWKVDWSDDMQLLCIKNHVCENKKELDPKAELSTVCIMVTQTMIRQHEITEERYRKLWRASQITSTLRHEKRQLTTF